MLVFICVQNYEGTAICICGDIGRLVVARTMLKKPCMKVDEGVMWGLVVVLEFA